MRFVDEAVHLLEHNGVHAQAVQVQALGVLGQQSQHDALAMSRRQGGHPHVDGLAAQPDGDAAILGQTFLGDVHVRHDLDARRQRSMQRTRRFEHVLQHPVDAKAHHGTVFERLDVDVRCAVAQSLHEHHVDQLDDGGVVFRFQQILDTPAVLHEAGQFRPVAQVVEQSAGIAAFGIVGGEGRLELVVGQQLHRQGQAVVPAQLGQHFRTGVRSHHNGKSTPPVSRRQDARRAGECIGNALH